ncbi:3-phosphoserine/phosphohydroxythreonine transaminase [Flocculibacter collagenilyticus]|uniref:3-phosphoserine/phosphohydroxythreonine transaminase n=1 Tax=Flocculibacter collagenilyticus TaxID=2744479 RepID=UPI0018F38474|nr:3-phosphoserine/phosphohydroxythreonine transaminase [Flocculibacter collagenilyticus]
MSVYNFCAGPAMLPAAVMEKAQKEFINWQNLGCSIMEVSHRSPAFLSVAERAEENLRKLMGISDEYAVLFMHGGGRGQFSAVPLNLTSASDQIGNYIVSGTWSKTAEIEAQKFCQTHACNVIQRVDGKLSTTPVSQWDLNNNAKFIHYCTNETVDGIEINEVPSFNDQLIVADMSSNILSKEIDVNQFDVIYAGAQKNIGPSGLSIVVIRKSIIGNKQTAIPCIQDYQLAYENNSMFNTPPTFSWYLAGVVFEWLLEQGGVSEVEQVNAEKARLLYDYIDNSKLYRNAISEQNRSIMNVPFQLADESLNQQFLAESEQQGLLALEGHRSVGGMRASIYNAMPLEGVKALVKFMHEFEGKVL